MIAPRWRKVLRDLASNRARTALVVLSIAVGVFATGTISGGQAMLADGLDRAYAQLAAPDGEIQLRPFDDRLVSQALSVPGVADVEGRRFVIVRMLVAAGWRDLRLVAIPDFRAIRINRIVPEIGQWPPTERTMLIERTAVAALGLGIGDRVLVEMPSGLRREIEVAGSVRDFARAPIQLNGRVWGYVSMETLTWLGERPGVNVVFVKTREGLPDRPGIDRVLEEVADRYRESGLEVQSFTGVLPGDYWARLIVNSMIQMLSVIGVVVVVSSGFLVVTTISALLVSQVRQIGVMKAIGATRRQTAAVYFATVALFSLAALLVGMPLGALGATGLATYGAGLLNLEAGPFQLPVGAIGLELLAGLVMPIAAALYPIAAGSRVTVLEAISTFGVGQGTTSWPIRLLARDLGLARPTVISLRNTFRRTGRLSLTLTTLGLAGGVFIATLGARESMLGEIDKVYAVSSYDVGMALDGAYPDGVLARLAKSAPDVVATESWPVIGVSRVVERRAGRQFRLEAPPVSSGLFRPSVIAGRGLHGDDENAIVINADLAQYDPKLDVGSTLDIDIGGVRRPWTVVGIARNLFDGPAAYVNPAYLARVGPRPGLSTDLRVATRAHDAGTWLAALADLEQRMKDSGVRVDRTWTIAEQRAGVAATFGIVVGFLMAMTVLLAVVGGLGLMGTLSLNVLERTREIGVLRAIGASDRAITRLVVVEGLVVALVSWPLAVVLAVPIQSVLGGILADFFLRAPLTTPSGPASAVVWLAVVFVLAVLSSWVPARAAARVTVIDALAYS